MTALKMALVAVVASLMLALAMTVSASAQVAGGTQQPLFTGGFLPVNGGFGLIIFVPGGNMVRLAGAAQIEGCTIEAVWRSTPSGEFATYIFRAPEFVNASFVQELPNGELPANSPLMVRCAKPAAIAQTQGSDTPSECRRDWPEEIKRAVLSRIAVPTTLCFFHYETEAEARSAGAWQTISQEAKDIYARRGGVGWWNGNSAMIIGPMKVGLLTHEIASANREWYASLQGKPFQWSKTESAAEFLRIGNWRVDPVSNYWVGDGLEGISYKTNPGNAESEIIRIMLNPDGRYTQVEIDAMVPAAYQAWAYKWVIVR